MSGWKHCPKCGKELEKILRHYGDHCASCKRHLNDAVFESIVGHWVCMEHVANDDDDNDDDEEYVSSCDVHVCRDCYLGPILISALEDVPGDEVSRVWFTNSGCVKCREAPGTFRVTCWNDDCGCDLVWETPMSMTCLRCMKTGTLKSRLSSWDCSCAVKPKQIPCPVPFGMPRSVSSSSSHDDHRRRERSRSPPRTVEGKLSDSNPGGKQKGDDLTTPQ